METKSSAQHIWQHLEEAVGNLEGGVGEPGHCFHMIREAMALLLQHEPDEVVRVVEDSSLPTQATMKWLLYECGRLPEVPAARLAGLRSAWKAQGGGAGL